VGFGFGFVGGGGFRVEVGLLFPKNGLSAGCEGGKWWELRKTTTVVEEGA